MTAPQRTIYRLVLAGLEVRVTADSVNADLAVVDFTAAIEARRVRPTVVRQLAAAFLQSVTDWTITDRDGRPVPRTVDGLLAQPRSVVWPLLRQWIELVADPPSIDEGEAETPGTPPEAPDGDVETGTDALLAELPTELLAPPVTELETADA